MIVTIYAAYPGVCSACDSHYAEGTHVRWDSGTRETVHFACPIGEIDAPPGKTPCPHCFTYHVGECL